MLFSFLCLFAADFLTYDEDATGRTTLANVTHSSVELGDEVEFTITAKKNPLGRNSLLASGKTIIGHRMLPPPSSASIIEITSGDHPKVTRLKRRESPPNRSPPAASSPLTPPHHPFTSPPLHHSTFPPFFPPHHHPHFVWHR